MHSVALLISLAFTRAQVDSGVVQAAEYSTPIDVSTSLAYIATLINHESSHYLFFLRGAFT